MQQLRNLARSTSYLHSVGMSLNIRKKQAIHWSELRLYAQDLRHQCHQLCTDCCRTCYEKDAINEWGSVVALTYIAAQRTFPDYSEMAESKSLLVRIDHTKLWLPLRSETNKVRVNSISQSPTMTTAGSGVGGFDAFIDYAEKMSPLGNASADDCACLLRQFILGPYHEW